MSIDFQGEPASVARGEVVVVVPAAVLRRQLRQVGHQDEEKVEEEGAGASFWWWRRCGRGEFTKRDACLLERSFGVLWKPQFILGRVAEGGHERAAGDPPEHDAGAAERGGRHVHLGAAAADLPPTVLRLFQGGGRRRARGERPFRTTATQELDSDFYTLS